jgi:hypothetical protein
MADLGEMSQTSLVTVSHSPVSSNARKNWITVACGLHGVHGRRRRRHSKWDFVSTGRRSAPMIGDSPIAITGRFPAVRGAGSEIPEHRFKQPAGYVSGLFTTSGQQHID